jgi:hypothetical protein
MIKNCIICEKQFEAASWATKSCSKQCRLKHNNSRRKKTNLNHLDTFNCKECGIEVTRYRIRSGFCSRSCASKKYIADGTFNQWKKYIPKKRTAEEEVNLKLRKGVSKLIRFYLFKQLIPKTSSTWKNLPYTPKDLKEHLEKQFDDNMSWNNYGKYWTIDHIIPQSKLLFKDFNDENFLKCWRLENLRPLEKIANIKKSNKIIGETNGTEKEN